MLAQLKSLSNPLTVASERTKRRYIDKAKECVFAVFETIAPKEKDLLLESIIFERNEQEQPADDTLQILKKIYIQAESWQFQRQVLSIIVQQMSFDGAQKIHLARQTNVIQHCLGFALSIPGIEFQLHCQHIHSQHCQSCIDLDETLQKVLENAEKKQIENKDALMFKLTNISRCCSNYRPPMTDVVQDLKTILPNLQNVHIFSDNAGCYKSSLTLSTLRHEIGKALASYNFSEAQNGKGPREIWTKKHTEEIGAGDSLKPSKNAVQLKVISDWTDIAISDSYEDPVPTTTKHKQSLICPLENCIREFKNKETLDQHILQGQCEHQLEKEALSDKSKIIYAKKLSNAPLCCPDMTAENVFEDDNLVNRCCGWALKSKKKKTVFNQKQKDFMIEKFQIGKRTGSKVDANTASEEMRLAQQDRNSDSNDYRAADEEKQKIHFEERDH
ncbi:unnamed protein product [Mytilus coruscus]|uniref:C2H2-type domain-containing protein n=1 Tax=Mytilus coruscus TaxID=42192 RepID=A0A6J8EQY1_MYTCO|nr:unnamed protein product [Mytilus coruscus]